MSIWILLGTLIAIYSPTKKAAIIIGWTVFALASPVMAYLAWMTKERGVFPKVTAAGIVAVSVMSSILLSGHLRLYDFIIDGVLFYIPFFRKIKR